ncbi:hypothetical protein M2192_008023 [Bradyrhizobium elkanii USDA 61]|uniref:Uncharacterized protein n=1 Tax=Bradyrhizobium elkanii TaxID=29448 RepID=A0A8I2C631_BRAEL|nr:hypothetical protein [Bradyrhizobium elkanii]MCS4011063.1 hypothetical protein [Bradyrhizobium elkanii USDA 61]QOZ20243.1 hypothetical protein XI02_38430 [Bradyrhizobium sp. CCBAU 21365]MCP1925470.1 hypothetical protein [Bradyrhizobium elkanii]MCS3477036.1 hypothetical protein [Bradyrhizobium elkanii]
MADRRAWHPIIFSCPTTGDRVQALLPDEASESLADNLYSISCAGCDGIHFVNLRTDAVVDPKRS